MTRVGIDLGTHKIALMVQDGHKVYPFVHIASTEEPRDHQLHELGMYAHNVCLLHDADSIWIEDTLIGNNRKYSMQLAETKGAVLAYLSHMRLARNSDIRLVNVSTWKKQVVGSGNAGKDDVRNYIHGTYPAYAPLCGDDQDLYDASCVVLYGQLIEKRAEDLQLG